MKIRTLPSPELEDSLASAVALKLLWSVPKWEIVGCGAWLSSLCSDVLFQPCLDPIPQWGGVGGLGPPLQLQEGVGGATTIVRAPPDRGLGEAPPKGIFYEKCLVKYCNFIVNLDHSLCRRSDGRSYVYLRVFCPRRQPSIIYEGIVLRLCIILRDETVRERRGSYNGFAVGCIPSICWMK